MTTPEIVLWSRLKNRKLSGHKFRRQHSIGPYILDFYCHALYLAIEVDGRQHQEPEVMEYDRIRTEYLESLNVQVVRFTNIEVLNDLDSVIQELERVMLRRRYINSALPRVRNTWCFFRLITDRVHREPLLVSPQPFLVFSLQGSLATMAQCLMAAH